MALPISIFYTIQDEAGDQSTVNFYLPSGTALSDAILFTQQLGGLIDPLITGGVVNAGFSVDVAAVGTFTAAAGSDIHEGAVWIYREAVNFLKRRFRLPTFDEAKVLPNSREVDRSDADVIALEVALETGIDLVPVGGTGVVQMTDFVDNDIASLESVTENFTKSRR